MHILHCIHDLREEGKHAILSHHPSTLQPPTTQAIAKETNPINSFQPSTNPPIPFSLWQEIEHIP